ncbi:MAG: hypothetical protein AB1393_12465 [Candidatus Edwardsbacteria bacterium]
MNDNKPGTTILLFPPQWAPFIPYLSIPLLTAYLKSKGEKVFQDDVNVRFYDYLLSESILERILKIAEERVSLFEKRPFLNLDEQKRYYNLIRVRLIGENLRGKVEKAKMTLRDPQMFYHPEGYYANYLVCDGFFNVFSMLHPHFQFNFVNTKYELITSREMLVQVLKSPDFELLNEFYSRYCENLLVNDPEVVGISLVYVGQIISSLLLCRHIKIKYPSVHITVGGPVLSSRKEMIRDIPELFTFFDSIIVNEGEFALEKLVKVVRLGGDFNQILGIIFPDSNGELVETGETVYLEPESWPTPDFEGIPFELYFVPARIIPLLSSRGCYWRKCAFCDTAHIYGPFRQGKSQNIKSEIQTLKKRWQTDTFTFVDESIPFKTINSLSQLEQKDRVSWFSLARIESIYLKKENVEQLRQSGAIALF